MTKSSCQYMSSKGFTIIEVVIVIIVIGILSAVVIPSMGAMTRHGAATAADELRRNLSHVQLMAISQSQRMRVSVNSAGTSYTVYACTNTTTCTTTVLDPSEPGNFSRDLPNGVTFTSGANSNLDFDSLGRPQSGGNLISTIPARNYTLSGGGNSVAVNVLPITGFAY